MCHHHKSLTVIIVIGIFNSVFSGAQKQITPFAIMSEFVWGIKNGDLEQVRDIVERKEVNVNQEIDGRPPILYAADYGQAAVIEYLISAGANVNSKDKHGITAILAAIWEGHKDCVKLLIEKGALKEGVAPDGTSYIDSAESNEIKALLA